MRILYVCHRFPFPPRRGGKIRPFNMIRHLSRTHELTVCSLVRSGEEASEIDGIGAHCHRYISSRVHPIPQLARMVARLPTSVPSSMGYFYSPELQRAIGALLSERPFDLVFVHCSSVAQYVEHVSGIPKILDFGDMDSEKWLEYVRHKSMLLAPGYWIEGRKLRRTERRLADAFDLCTATTRAEWETLKSLGSATPSGWFPNGVDAEFFSPDESPHSTRRICFVGRMDYFPNQECMFRFCRDTWPLIRSRFPDMQLDIVGADPSPAVRDLARLSGVNVTGSVPDVRPYVRRAAVMVAPLSIARGTQNKILESMAMGVPVVSSAIAARGVDAVPGEHLLVADDATDIADAVGRVVGDPVFRARLARAGRERVLSHHSWSASMQRLDGLIEGCVESFRDSR